MTFEMQPCFLQFQKVSDC